MFRPYGNFELGFFYSFASPLLPPPTHAHTYKIENVDKHVYSIKRGFLMKKKK